MTTYNTYQEAKIANPEYAIFEYLGDFGTDKDIIDTFDVHSVAMKECNPADHCMAVEKFKDSGKRLIDGDLYINLDGNVIKYEARLGLGVDRESSQNSRRYILKAAALEEKPKRVKVSYEKVEGSIFDLQSDYESGCLFGGSSGLVKVSSLAYLGACCETGSIYRRVETEISERDEFISEAYKSMVGIERALDVCEEHLGAMFDSGKFKLVEGE